MNKRRGPTLSLRAKGPLAMFTRPELKTERVSYEVPTPSSVRGIFEAICWKPAIQWHVERIYVFNAISFTAIKRNELNGKAIPPSKQMMDRGVREFTYGIYGINIEDEQTRAQRNTLALRNVDYQFEAFFTLTDKAGPDDNIYKFIDMFTRRVDNGQHFYQPYFGCRECIAQVLSPIESPEAHAISISKELGIMLWDVEFGGDETKKNTPLFFNAKIENGKIDIPLYPIGREEVSYDIESAF
ncbi:MAG: type I-C CRISPR-associated protein Cas5 [Deltaproteobacteria bacterium]|nr:type I-C CRISPR-associated protein Cas5 [Deltaproteobacteria bacterium]